MREAEAKGLLSHAPLEIEVFGVFGSLGSMGSFRSLGSLRPLMSVGSSRSLRFLASLRSLKFFDALWMKFDTTLLWCFPWPHNEDGTHPCGRLKQKDYFHMLQWK